MKDLLKLEGLSVGYRTKGVDVTVVSDIQASISKGELVCLLGKNGAGKSTLMRTIMHIQSPLSGSVKLKGEDVCEYGSRKLAQEIGLVLTDRIEMANMSVYDIVKSGRIPYSNFIGKVSKDDRSIIEDCIENLDLNDLMNKSISELSDGERQKVMIARALAQQTDLILLDEPTAHLDMINKLQLKDLIKGVTRNHDTGVLMSTHDLALALQYADKVWLINDEGRLTEGRPEELVVDGVFSDAFKSESIKFDLNSGAFFSNNISSRKVEVIGEGHEAIWLERAAIRFGAEAGSGDITIKTENSNWILKNKGTVVGVLSFSECISELSKLLEPK